MVKASLLLACLLMVSEPLVAAQQTPGEVVLWSGTTFDFATTRYAINRGAAEANPLVGQQPWRQATVMFGVTGLTDFAAWRLQRHHPKLAKAIRFAIGGAHIAVGTHNINIVRGLK